MVIQIKNSARLAFNCLVILLIALVMVRYAFGLAIPGIVLTAIIVLIAAVGNRDEILAISMCCIPLHEAIDLYIALAMCAVILVVKTFSAIRIGFSTVLCIAIIIWETLHFFLAGSNLQLTITSLIPFVFLAVILSLDVSDIDYAFIVRSVAVVSIAMGFMLLLNCIVNADYNLALAFSNLERLGHVAEDEILSGGRIHPNTLGIINVLSATALFQLRSVKKNKKMDYVFIVLLITIGVLTSSRTFLVCLLIMIILLVFGQKGDIRKKMRFITILVMVTVLSLVLLNLIFPTVLEYYIGRFKVDDITTGRDTLMILYHNFISSNLWVMLFGVGLSNLPEKVINIYRVSPRSVPHNSIQEIIVAWGVPGLVMFGLLIFMMIIESKKYCVRKSILNYSPLIIILVKSLAGQILTSGYTLLALVFAYLSMCQDFEINESKKLSL